MPDFRAPHAQAIIQLFNQLIKAGYEEPEIEWIRDGWLVARKLFPCWEISVGCVIGGHSFARKHSLNSGSMAKRIRNRF